MYYSSKALECTIGSAQCNMPFWTIQLPNPRHINLHTYTHTHTEHYVIVTFLFLFVRSMKSVLLYCYCVRIFWCLVHTSSRAHYIYRLYNEDEVIKISVCLWVPYAQFSEIPFNVNFTMIIIVNWIFSMLCILLNRMYIVDFFSLFVFFEQKCFIWVSNSDEIIERRG